MSRAGRNFSVAARVLVIVALLVLLLRNLSLENPIMNADEYAYFAQSQYLGELPRLYEQDPGIQKVNNPVFCALGYWAICVAHAPAKVMVALNAFLFVAGVCILADLLFRVTGRHSLLHLLLLLLMPTSSYSAYFMPESLYFCLFCALAWTIVVLPPRHFAVGIPLAGFLLGLLLLTKPHALALFAAVFATLGAVGFAPLGIRKRWLIVVVGMVSMSACFYVVTVTINYLLTKHFVATPAGIIGPLYTPMMQEGMALASFGTRVSALLHNLAGHLSLIALLYWLPIGIAAMALWRFWTTRALATGSERMYLLIVFTIFATGATLFMTANFTAQVSLTWAPEEAVRVHGRYYSFALALLITLFFALNREPFDHATVRISAGVGLVMVATVFWWTRRSFALVPYDFPEVFAFSTLVAHGTFVLVVLGVLAASAIAWPARVVGLYALGLAVVSSLSNYEVTAWQFGHARKTESLHSQGSALRDLLTDASRPHGVVIGSDRARLAYFLFGFNARVSVLTRPVLSEVKGADLPPDALWIAALDDYTFDFTPHPEIQTKVFALGSIKSGQKVVRAVFGPAH